MPESFIPWLAHDVIGGSVGVLNNSENIFWEFDANIMAKRELHFALVL